MAARCMVFHSVCQTTHLLAQMKDNGVCVSLLCVSPQTGQQREAWHGRGASSGARPGGDAAALLRLGPLSTGTASSNGAAVGGISIGSSSSNSTLLPLTARSDRDRDRSSNGPAGWSHFHTSGRFGRAAGAQGGSHTPRDSHGGSGGSDAGGDHRFQSLGSPFKGGSSAGSSGGGGNFSSSRHGLQRSVSDSGGAGAGAGSATDPGHGFGTPQQRDRLFGASSSSRHGGHQLAGTQYGGGGSYAADDKLTWRDSNRQQQQQQPHGSMQQSPVGPHGRATSKVGAASIRILMPSKHARCAHTVLLLFAVAFPQQLPGSYVAFAYQYLLRCLRLFLLTSSPLAALVAVAAVLSAAACAHFL